MVGYEEKALCRKIAKTFDIAARKGIEPQALIKNWLHSSAARKIYEKDFNEIAQSAVYQFNSLQKEFPVNENVGTGDDADILYWVGYMLTYLQFYGEMPPEELWDRYDVIRFSEAYDTLHTVSSKRAAEEFMEEFQRAS